MGKLKKTLTKILFISIFFSYILALNGKCGYDENLYGGTAILDGQLVLRYENEWKSVCSNNFTQEAASVACRSIFGANSEVRQFSIHGECVIQDFWLDNVKCTGEEDSLLQCCHDSMGIANCMEDQCVTLECTRVGSDISTQLQDGILEVQYNGVWKYVCDDKFTQEVGNVACQSISGPGFYAAQITTNQLCTGLDTVDFWLDDLVCTGSEANLAECGGYSGFGFHDCGETECVRLVCEQLPDIIPNVLIHSEAGIISISYQDEIRSICDDGFGEANAVVACTQLYGNPNYFSFATRQQCEYNGYWLDQVACSGVETSLEECNHNPWGEHDCSDSECVLLYCVGGGPEPPLVQQIPEGQLLHGNTGILSILYKEEARAICDNSFEQESAQVACLELYQDPIVISFTTGNPCDFEDFWLDDIMCIGTESLIRECPHTGWGGHNCDHTYECVRVYCQGGGPQPEAPEILVVPSSRPPVTQITVPQAHLRHSPVGILYMNYLGQNKAICDNQFSLAAAQVACLELYADSTVIQLQTGKSCPEQDFWLDDILCTGEEQSLVACQHNEFGVHNCDWTNECIQVYCVGGGPQPNDEYLVHSESGILSVLHESEIRSICDDEFNDFSAQTACNSLYGSPEIMQYSTNQPCNIVDFWLNNVACTQVQSTLSSCPHDAWGVHNCQDNECIQLFCVAGGPVPEGYAQPESATLVHNTVTGILSIEYKGESRGLCDDGFGIAEASTACYQLYGTRDVNSFATGLACDYQDYWLDDIQCTDTTENLGQCEHLSWGQHNCYEHECVELFCINNGPQPTYEIEVDETLSIKVTQNGESNSIRIDNCKSNSIRIDNGKSNSIRIDNGKSNSIRISQGDVESAGYSYTLSHGLNGQFTVTYDGSSRDICQDGFDQNAADILCHQMYGVCAIQFDIGQRCTYSKFWIDDLVCTGSEDHILECEHSNLGDHNCDSTRECVNVYCDGFGPQFPGIIIFQNNDGILQVNRNGDIKEVCDDGFNQVSAEIACQQMFGVGVTEFQISQDCQYSDFWLDQIDCQGHEQRLVDCGHNDYGVHDCSPTQCIKIICAQGFGYQVQEDEAPVLVHNQTSGVLSITFRGTTQAICDDAFELPSAQVACNELYGSPEVAQFTQGNQCDYHNFWLDDIVCTGGEETLVECNHLSWGQHNCNWQFECIQVYCYGGGPMIIPPPPPPPEVPQSFLEQSVTGIISVNYLGENRAICDDGWNDDGARVACNELYGSDFMSWETGKQCTYDTYWLDQVNCNGSERKLEECSHNLWGEHDCESNECVQVWCVSGPNPNKAHLIHQSSGILSIIFQGEIRSICDNLFNDFSAQTACNELYGSPDVVFYQRNVPCDFPDFWLDSIACTQVQQEIQDCPHNEWGVHDCDPASECVALQCGGFGPQFSLYPDGETFQVSEFAGEVAEATLVHNLESGILSMYYLDQFKGICDDSFGILNAQVACRELYTDPEVIGFTTGMECDYDDFWLDDLQCDGEEEFLVDCVHLAFGDHNCDPSRECVELFCVGGGPQGRVVIETNLVIAPSTDDLNGGNLLGVTRINAQGILSLTFQGETRGICDDGFTDNAARVACKEIYGPSSTLSHWDGRQRCSNDGFWLDQVDCQGDEESLSECQHNDYGQHDCTPNECIALFCDGEILPNTAPIVHGGSGILEVLYNGEIKSICDDGFSQINAETACNELYGNPVVSEYKIGQTCQINDYWIDDIDCTEVKDKLTECSHTAFGVHNCYPGECVFLHCAGQPEAFIGEAEPPEVNIFLIHNQDTGILSISRAGEPRAICDDGWSDINSHIACNQMYGSPEFDSYESGHQCDYQQFWLDQVACTGSEERIKDCQHNDWGTHDCFPQSECVQLYCTAGGPQFPRGVVIQNPQNAVISVKYNDQLRGICDDGFTREDASVICKELYGSPAVSQFFTRQQCDYQDFWVDQLVCNGEESLVDKCEHNQYGVHDCNWRYECVRVYCVGSGPQLPLVSAVHSQSGLLGATFQGQIRQVADTGFDMNAARTACRELYSSPDVTSFRGGEPCEIEDGFWLDNLVCTEKTATLDSCEHNQYGETQEGVGQNNCVRLYCESGGPQPPRSRLVHNQETGLLNIRYLGQVRSVCDDRFSQADAEVACNELYGSNVVIQYYSGQQCDFEEFWLDEVVCEGSEETIDQCAHAKWGIHNCDPERECVSVFCLNGGPQPFDPPMISHSRNGIISVTFNGNSYGLCDSTFNDQAASVACFELYGDAAFRSYSQGHSCEYSVFWPEEIQCLGEETSLSECQKIIIENEVCSSESNCVQLFCQGNGPQLDVILIEQDGETGIVLVNRNGEVKPVCDDGFTLESAQVFCNELFDNPAVVLFSHGVACSPHTEFWLDDVICNGDEVSLSKCNHAAWGQNNCNPEFECVQVYCVGGGAQPPSHTTQSSTGILSITYLGVARSVCDDHFNDQSAAVACTEMYGTPDFISYSHGARCNYDDFWLDDVICEGTELRLADCPHQPWGVSNCHRENNCIRIFCVDGGAQPTVGRAYQSEKSGLLLFNVDGDVKGICDNGFGELEAQVACKELFGSPVIISFLQGQDCSAETTFFWLDDVECDGNENFIGDCSHSPLEVHNCKPENECIQLICAGGGYRNPDYEEHIFITHSVEGTINLVYGGETRSICGQRFTDFSANVVCRQLYGDPVFIRWSSGHQCQHDNFWLSHVDCLGSEESIMDCPHSDLGDTSCQSNECVHIFCRAGGPLVGASPLMHNNNGILSIRHEGQVRAVCDDGFSLTEAEVACAELYQNPAVIEFVVGQPCAQQKFWLDDVSCSGGQTRLADCNHAEWLDHDCNWQTECIRLTCKGGGYQSGHSHPSLVHNSESGVLSMTYNGETRGICDDSFGLQEAKIACFELYGEYDVLHYLHGFECDYDNFWTDDIECDGNEVRLGDCSHTAWGQHNCNQETECVQLWCTAGGPTLIAEGVLSLASNHILQITFNDQKRSVCDDEFNQANAEVACFELTGDATVNTFSTGHRCNIDDFWLDNVSCKGTEETFSECSHRRWGMHNCDPINECVELLCGTQEAQVIEIAHDGETGILGLAVNGILGGICDDEFSTASAQVVCQELYGSPEVLQWSQGNTCIPSYEDFWLDDINCEGNEDHLMNCRHSPLGIHNCALASECIQLFCIAGGPQPVAHLEQNNNGILSMVYQGQSKGICSHGFDDNAARVACTELYLLPEFISYEINEQCIYEEAWIDRIICNGEEANIQECLHSKFGEVQCDTSNTCIQIYCEGGGPQPDIIYLIHNQETGILSMEYDGVDKSICDDGFDERSAQVACRQLYGRRTSLISFSHGHACEYEDFWLDNVECQGDERSIAACSHSPFGEHNCGVKECIQLYCSDGVQPAEEPPMLTQNSIGILSMSFNGQNRAVCDDGFDDNAAKVSCMELYGNEQFISYQTAQPCLYQDFWLDDIQCEGNEETVFGCNHRALGAHNCNYRNECVRLFCYEGGAEAPLFDSKGSLLQSENGILSYNYHDQIRAICDDGFSDYSASVACMQLYGSPHFIEYTQGNQCDFENFWLDDVSCNGNEINIAECPHSAFGVHNCFQGECIQLFCRGGGPVPDGFSREEDTFVKDEKAQLDHEHSCAILYSECDYNGATIIICEGDEDIRETLVGDWKVMSIWVPQQYTLELSPDASGHGLEVSSNIPCFGGVRSGQLVDTETEFLLFEKSLKHTKNMKLIKKICYIIKAGGVSSISYRDSI